MGLKTRFKRAVARARYAAVGAAIGAAIGGLFGRSAASTGGATGALVGALVAEKRYSEGGWFGSLGGDGETDSDSAGVSGRLAETKESLPS